ncbi:TPA: RHS repeat protein [Kluyvera intermedia]|nr:RHS repeat protein [Kluyvera intermedia]
MFQLKSFYAAEQGSYRHRCLALINEEGHVDWSADYDVWGSLLSENNPHSLVQDLLLPGQQYDEETGLHYNRHRYYNPRQEQYIHAGPDRVDGGMEWVCISVGSG